MPSSAAPGLYLHVPFCSAICPHCDFAVRTGCGPGETVVGIERRRVRDGATAAVSCL